MGNTNSKKNIGPTQSNRNEKEVKVWFQKITLSPELQEKYANCFIQNDFDDLDVISHMTKDDLKFMKKKLNLSNGNYRKICVAVDALKQRSKSSSPNNPWDINCYLFENSSLSILLLSLDDIDPSLHSSVGQFKLIFMALNGSLENVKQVYLTYTRNLVYRFQTSLDVHLSSLKDSPEIFKDKIWRTEKRGMETKWREEIYKIFLKYALQFPNNFDREEGLVVIPVVAGYKSKEDALKVCNNGPKCIGATDDGYFGRGIYFTTHINYAKKFGKFLVIFWVFIGNLYPVIEFPHPPVGSDVYYENLPIYQKPTLYGKPQKNDKVIGLGLEGKTIKTITYDTHYTVVRPFTDEGMTENTKQYVPCEVEKMNGGNVYDEVVVFQESHILPMYLIELH